MKAAIYARYSTDKQQATSITAQINRCSEYCREKAIDIVGIYADEAMSGTNTNRDGFQRLLEAAAQRTFDVVVIYDISRGSRDVGDWFAFRKLMSNLRIAVISATEHLGDLDNPSDFLAELITVGLGQHSVLQTRQKSIAGTKVKAADGKFCGGTPPLGYIIVDGNYVTEPTEAEAVRHAYALYADGCGYGYIVDELARMGIKSKRGRKIGENALFAILRNERYIGRYSWNKRHVKHMRQWAGGIPNPDAIIINDKIPRIIDDDTWRRVQKRVKENTHNKMNNSKRDYLLSGLLRCAECGGAFSGATNSYKNGYEYSFYTCANKKRLHTCTAKNIAANDIEPLIINLIKDRILNGKFLEDTADAILATASSVKDDRDEYLKEIDKLDTKIYNLTKTLADGFDSSAVREALGDLEARKKVLKLQLNTAAPAPNIPDRADLLADLYEDADRAMRDPTSMRELIHKYIVKIEIAEDEITIYAIPDLAHGSHIDILCADDKKSGQCPGKTADTLTATGCGGGI